MKLLLNVSTLSGTGVTQVAVSTILEFSKLEEIDLYVFVSKVVYDNLKISGIDQSKVKLFLITSHPIKGLSGMKARKLMISLEEQIKPDAVFTLFGPACWSPKSIHISGFANSYFVYPFNSYSINFTFLEKIKIFFRKKIHYFFLKRESEYFICETADMKMKLSKWLGISLNNIFVVSNTFNNYFKKDNVRELAVTEQIANKVSSNCFKFLFLASGDKHKNHLILNTVIPYFKKTYPEKEIVFITTLSEEQYNTFFLDEVKDYIINIGRVKVDECPSLYDFADALFLPTLIESFSANYAEAMIMDTPILTSNYSFAKDICADSAIFFDPLDKVDICEKIVAIIENEELRNKLVLSGRERVRFFGSANDRAAKYYNVIKHIVSNGI